MGTADCALITWQHNDVSKTVCAYYTCLDNRHQQKLAVMCAYLTEQGEWCRYWIGYTISGRNWAPTPLVYCLRIIYFCGPLDSRQVDQLLDGTGSTPGGLATGWHWIHTTLSGYCMGGTGWHIHSTVSVATLPSSSSMYDVCIVLTTSPRHFQPKTTCNFHSSVALVMTLPVSNALRLYPESSGGALQC